MCTYVNTNLINTTHSMTDSTSISAISATSTAPVNTYDNERMSHFQLVGEFHDVFEHPQRDTLFTDCFTQAPKLITLRIDLVREELNEFIDAYKIDDLVEMADALCDMAYVLYGAGQALGFNLDTLTTQMKIDTTTPSDLKRRSLAVSSKNSDDTTTIDIEVALMSNSLDEICKLKEEHKLAEMVEFFVMILGCVYRLGHALDFHMDLMFREVHRSNMTKRCDNIDDAEASVHLYEKEGRAARIGKKGEYYVIYDAVTAKVLKNYKWQMPDLKQFFAN